MSLPTRQSYGAPTVFPNSKFPCSKLVIFGVGLIGASLALALKQANFVQHIVGVDQSQESLAYALEKGIIDEIGDISAETLENAELIVLAAPVTKITEILERIAPFLSERTTLTDTGSTKGFIVDIARKALGPRIAQFIPAHPIAGREQHGVRAALCELYQDKKVVLCRLAETQNTAFDLVQSMWKAAGAYSHEMTVSQHDALFAVVSHLPHVLAYALVTQIVQSEDVELKFEYAGSGFRDFSRIAASSPEVWRDICLTNQEALLQELTSYQKTLLGISELIRNSDGPGLEALFTIASQARGAWQG